MRRAIDPFRGLFVIVALLAFIAPAAAQSNPFDTPPPGQFPSQQAGSGGGFGDSRDRVNVTARAAATEVTPGSEVPVAVIFDHQPKWHTWTPEGVNVEGAAEFSGAIRTNVVPQVAAGSAIVPHASLIQWPEPHLVEMNLLGTPEPFAVLEGRAIAYVPVTIADDATPGAASLTLKVTFQSCDDRTCLMPVFDHEVTVAFNIVEGEPVKATDHELGGVFDGFDTAAFDSIAGEVEAPPAGGYGDSRDQVAVSARPAAVNVTPGSQVPVAVTLDHQPGWHTWAPAGILLEGSEEFENAIHTEVKTASPTAADGSSPPLVPHTGFMQWPEPHLIEMNLLGTPQQFTVMEGRTVAYLPVSIAEDAEPGESVLTLKLTFQSCDEFTCLPPAFDHEVRVRFNIVEGEPLTYSSGSLPEGFEDFDTTLFQKIATATGAADASGVTSDAAPPATGTASPSRPTFFGIELPSTEGPLGLLILALLSALGGFILNLTPCVLPIIPIKVLTISQHAGSPGKSLVLGTWMALGVVAFWFAIGIPVAFIAGVTDPSRIFGIWWLTLGIGLVIGAMGIGIMGMFQFRIPNALYAVNPRADTAWGSFVFGVMTAVLGLPCFGFVAGALLAGAATLPATTVMVIFISIGVGMAAPYMVLAAKPSLVDRIPRTGPASELVKQVMGLLLLAAAAFFIGSGLIALVAERPYLGKQLHWWAVALFAGLAALWLIVRTFAITKHAGPRVGFFIVGVIVAGLAVLYAADSTSKARSSWETLQAANQSSPGSFNTSTWNHWTPASFQAARDQGHVVVLDFTAEWCLICKSLKATVLNREPVSSILAEQDVVTFTVDLTSLKDPGWDFLRDLGQTGIPMLAVYRPGEETPWMSNAYTPQQVVDALDWARTTRVARND